MYRFLMTLFAAALLLSSRGSVAQEDLRDRLHALGEKSCRKALSGNFNGLAGRDFVAEVKKAGISADHYCACVGRGFEIQTGGTGDEDPAVFMERLLTKTLSECVAEPNTEWAYADELDVEDFAYDEGDVHMCGMALDGELMVPSFNGDAIKAQMQRTGQSREDLCVCAARYFTAGGEPLRAELEAHSNGPVVYASTMAGAINVCLLASSPPLR